MDCDLTGENIALTVYRIQSGEKALMQSNRVCNTDK